MLYIDMTGDFNGKLVDNGIETSHIDYRIVNNKIAEYMGKNHGQTTHALIKFANRWYFYDKNYSYQPTLNIIFQSSHTSWCLAKVNPKDQNLFAGKKEINLANDNYISNFVIKKYERANNQFRIFCIAVLVNIAITAIVATIVFLLFPPAAYLVLAIVLPLTWATFGSYIVGMVALLVEMGKNSTPYLIISDNLDDPLVNNSNYESGLTFYQQGDSTKSNKPTMANPSADLAFG